MGIKSKRVFKALLLSEAINRPKLQGRIMAVWIKGIILFGG